MAAAFAPGCGPNAQSLPERQTPHWHLCDCRVPCGWSCELAHIPALTLMTDSSTCGLSGSWDAVSSVAGASDMLLAARLWQAHGAGLPARKRQVRWSLQGAVQQLRVPQPMLRLLCRGL